MDSQASPVPAPAPSAAEVLPALYRSILDRVAILERHGARAEAGRIRSAASRTYSGAWDDAARRRMIGLIARCERSMIDSERPRGWTLRRRSEATR